MTNLDPGDAIPDSNNLARWCRASDVDPETDWPQMSAFYPRQNEDYLSTNWIEYHAQDHDVAVRAIRDSIPLTLTVGGRFVVLNVGKVIDSIAQGGGLCPSVRFCPQCDNPSHVALAWEDMAENHQSVAAELFALIASENIYLGKMS